MIKQLLLLIAICISYSGISQNRCYNCLVFHGDSISVDSTIEVPNLPFVFNAPDYSDLPDGFWSAPLESQLLFTMFEIKDGKLNGRAIELVNPISAEDLEEVDKFKEYNFVDGKANGEFIRWWTYSGNKMSTHGYYTNSLEDSVWLDYYGDFADYALMSEKHFRKHDLHGLMKTWYPNGNLESEIEYVKGIPCGNKTTYHFNGRKAVELLYNCESGFYISDNFNYLNSYDPNGKPLVIDGEGIHKIYDDIGRVWKSGPIENGLREGEWKKYSSSGQLINIEYYDKGLKVR